MFLVLGFVKDMVWVIACLTPVFVIQELAWLCEVLPHIASIFTPVTAVTFWLGLRVFLPLLLPTDVCLGKPLISTSNSVLYGLIKFFCECKSFPVALIGFSGYTVVSAIVVISFLWLHSYITPMRFHRLAMHYIEWCWWNCNFLIVQDRKYS